MDHFIDSSQRKSLFDIAAERNISINILYKNIARQHLNNNIVESHLN